MTCRRLVLGLLAATLLAAWSVFLFAQQPTFRVNVDLVRVDALVTERGRPVAGLTAADFELKDNDVPQDIQLATLTGTVQVVLALDTSRSVGGRRLDYLKRASRSLLNALAPRDAISVLTFNQRVVLRANAEHDRVAVERAIDSLDAGGRTALCDAVYAGLSLVAPDTGRSLLLLFSDGGDNASFLSRDAVMASVKHSMATIYTVGVRGGERGMVWPGLLWDLADSGGGSLLWADDDSRLPAVFMTVLNEFRSRYLLSYTPTGVKRDDGWHKITVTLKTRPGKVKARPGYFATRTR